jgi:MscS family membrane protein
MNLFAAASAATGNLELELASWIPALAIAAATLVAYSLLRPILKRTGKGPGARYLHSLAPALSNLLFVVGAKLFGDLAPIHGKLALWYDHVVYILAVLLLLILLRKALLIGLELGAVQSNRSQTLQQGFVPLLRNLITLFIFLTGGIMVLKHFNYDVMSLLAALGVGSLAVGLAAKETLSNMISGFTLIIDRNLRPGDRVNLAGSVGDVEEIGLRSTRIRTGDGNTLIVPNSEMVNNRILNLSLPLPEVVCSLALRVPYDVPFAKVRALSLETLSGLRLAKKGSLPWVHLSSLADGHQQISLGFWVERGDLADEAVSEANERLVDALRREGIPLVPSPAAPQPARS